MNQIKPKNGGFCEYNAPEGSRSFARISIPAGGEFHFYFEGKQRENVRGFRDSPGRALSSPAVPILRGSLHRRRAFLCSTPRLPSPILPYKTCLFMYFLSSFLNFPALGASSISTPPPLTRPTSPHPLSVISNTYIDILSS